MCSLVYEAQYKLLNHMVGDGETGGPICFSRTIWLQRYISEKKYQKWHVQVYKGVGGMRPFYSRGPILTLLVNIKHTVFRNSTYMCKCNQSFLWFNQGDVLKIAYIFSPLQTNMP